MVYFACLVTDCLLIQTQNPAATSVCPELKAEVIGTWRKASVPPKQVKIGTGEHFPQDNLTPGAVVPHVSSPSPANILGRGPDVSLCQQPAQLWLVATSQAAPHHHHQDAAGISCREPALER